MSYVIHGVLSTVTRALRSNRVIECVHVHAGDHGRPYVCEDPRSNSPALEIARG